MREAERRPRYQSAVMKWVKQGLDRGRQVVRYGYQSAVMKSLVVTQRMAAACGTVVQWCSGAVECSGAVVQWCSGAVE